MAKEFKLEDPGEGIHEVEIQEVLVSEGDEIKEGENVFVVESDKAAIELPCPFSGKIASIDVEQGDIVEVGSVLLTVEKGEAESKAKKEEPQEEPQEEEKEEEDDEEEDEEEEETADEEEAEETADEKAAEEETEAAEEDEKDTRSKKGRDDGPVPATPVVRRIAKEEGIDLKKIEGTGPGGRIMKEDLEQAEDAGRDRSEEAPEKKAKEEAKERPLRTRGMPKRDAQLPDFSRWGETERVALRSIRRATANRMAMSWQEIPHVTHQDLVDITDLEEFRRRNKDDVEEKGGRLTLTVFAMKALVSALREHPRFNASLDTESGEIVLKHYFNIGVAVDTDEGLMVPVVREVDRKPVTELARELQDLAHTARAGELGKQDMQGGSFTITNIGPLGGRSFQPIINYPEVGILGMGRARLEPLVEGTPEDFQIRPRLMLPLCMAFDHRVNDGADAARFMATLMTTLTDLEALMLSM
ncbi:MAG: dihydrolipoamide acetyltransferase family protein [Rhodovibrionaceae bacterium]|nr:dihydrolipoamide acetyltransferase family protein [Rhodovibrionaceae bacterium]